MRSDPAEGRASPENVLFQRRRACPQAVPATLTQETPFFQQTDTLWDSGYTSQNGTGLMSAAERRQKLFKFKNKGNVAE